MRLNLRKVSLVATPASQGKLAVINNGGFAGFKVCNRCGYTVLGDEPAANPHTTPWGTACSGTLQAHLSLGHEFETDILRLSFEGYRDERTEFWFSLLYALLEGASTALEIERQDIDGCLYTIAGNGAGPAIVGNSAETPEGILTRRALILFDDVPGGAGHVRRIAHENTLLDILRVALERLEHCECGGPEGNASCYGCLRNYRNQFCHDLLNRGMVIEFLRKALPS